MKRSIPILIAALVVTGTATAAAGSRSETVTVRGPGFTTYVTRELPAAEIAVAVYANGEELKYQIVSSRSIDFVGRGLIVRVTVPRGEGPGMVRIASMRQSTVRVRIVAQWKA